MVDLKKMNSIAIGIILIGVALVNLFIIGVWMLVQQNHHPQRSSISVFVVITGIIFVVAGYYSYRALRGATDTVTGGAQDHIFLGYHHKETPKKTTEKFLVIALVMLILGALITPSASLERTVLYGIIGFVLLILFMRWALEPDPIRPVDIPEEIFFTREELGDTLTRELVVDLPYEQAFNQCIGIIHSLWMTPWVEEDLPNGKIVFDFGDSRLSFILKAVDGQHTEIFLSLLPDLPQKWTPNKNRRQSIRYLEQIATELRRSR